MQCDVELTPRQTLNRGKKPVPLPALQISQFSQQLDLDVLVAVFDLALRLRMVWCAGAMLHFPVRARLIDLLIAELPPVVRVQDPHLPSKITQQCTHDGIHAFSCRQIVRDVTCLWHTALELHRTKPDEAR